MIWKRTFDLDSVNATGKNTLVEHMAIEFTKIDNNFLEATMPVNATTVQPFRILHGGANVVLAETLGSVASVLCLEENSGLMPVGLEINANHLKSVREGKIVTGRCSPIRIGRSIHVWNIEIFDETGDLTCISRLTVSIVPMKK